MRLLTVLLGLVALACGFGLAMFCAGHSLDLLRLWNTGKAIYSVSAASMATPAPGDPLSPTGGWTPPQVIPAHPNWTWHMKGGKTYSNVVITNLSRSEVTITHALGIAHLPLDALPADVQRELQYTPPPSYADAIMLTPMASLLDGKLIDATGQAVATPGAAIKYYAIYYSANWCPPCRAFTLALADWYRTFKPQHPNFELIFVSEDRTEADMASYMSQAQMPWPAVKYDQLERINGTFRGPGIESYANAGIPDLVLVDATGNVLADSYNGSTYVGPQSVVEYANANVSSN